MDLVSCKHCKRKIEKDFEICPFCLGNLKVEMKPANCCPFCGKGIKKEYKVCPHCGKQLFQKKEPDTGLSKQAVTLAVQQPPVQQSPVQQPSQPFAENNQNSCPNCGFINKSGSKFCKNCGTKLQ